MASPTLLDFQITLASWRQIPRLQSRLQKAATVTLEHLPSKLRLPFTANVLLTGDAQVRQLNRDFRGLDKATNVLSFPQHEPSALPALRGLQHTVELGDIALARQYVVAEAKKEHKILINHVTHLVIHGLLHLFGYDHLHDDDAAHMEKLETSIMHALGLPDPYAPLIAPRPRKNKNRP